jgi:hypothetical protein
MVFQLALTTAVRGLPEAGWDGHAVSDGTCGLFHGRVQLETVSWKSTRLQHNPFQFGFADIPQLKRN